jgi:hypothetical protein
MLLDQITELREAVDAVLGRKNYRRSCAVQEARKQFAI